MSDLTHQSDSIIREAGQSLDHQRSGGRRIKSVGRASAKTKARHFGKKILYFFLTILAILSVAGIAGTVLLNGIGFGGIMVTMLAMVVALVVFAKFPKLKIPERADLVTDNPKQLVARTEMWLEHQRPALPPPAAKLVNGIGMQLDELQMQLEEVDQKHPTAAQIRKLVGEDLPEMVEGFQRIPEKMRYEKNAGTTPAKQLEDGLGVIATEIDSITRQLAQGSLDDLAIRTRYLDYKYGDADALPAPDSASKSNPENT